MKTQSEGSAQPAMCSAEVIGCLDKLIDSPLIKEDYYFGRTSYVCSSLKTIAENVIDSIDSIRRDIEKKQPISNGKLISIDDRLCQIISLIEVIDQRVHNDHITNLEDLALCYEEQKSKTQQS